MVWEITNLKNTHAMRRELLKAAGVGMLGTVPPVHRFGSAATQAQGRKNRPNIVFILADDPGEQHDLAGERKDKKRELLETLHDWQRQAGAKFPEGQPKCS